MGSKHAKKPKDPFAQDRAAAREELAGLFEVSSLATDDENVISPEQFEHYADLFSDIRMGRTLIDVTPDELEGDKDAVNAYRAGLMGNFAEIMQTSSGRMLLEGLARQEDLPEDQRRAIEMSPFLDNDDNLGLEDMDAAGDGNGITTRAERAAGGSPMHDHNARIRPMKDGGLLPFPDWKKEQDEHHGLDTLVAFNPGDTFHAGIADWGGEIRPDVMLFHELTHAYHAIHGSLRTGMGLDGDGEEMCLVEPQAMGLLDTGDESEVERILTENNYRYQRNQLEGRKGALPGDGTLAMRTQYASAWE